LNCSTAAELIWLKEAPLSTKSRTLSPLNLAAMTGRVPSIVTGKLKADRLQAANEA
jgi:hypothetical protein